jgi:hypothetical protein
MLALSWLSIGPMLESRLRDGVRLCELLHRWRHTESQDRIVQCWLEEAGARLNQIPEPEESDRPDHRPALLELHQGLKATARFYGMCPEPPPWVTAEWL